MFDDRRDSTDWALSSSTSASLLRGAITGLAREWSLAEPLPQQPEACQPRTVITELAYGAALRRRASSTMGSWASLAFSPR